MNAAGTGFGSMEIGAANPVTRPNILFLTPTLPHITGTGSAIRAGVTLEALARYFNVYVFHAELWGWHQASFNTGLVLRRAARYVYYVPENGELPMPRIMAEHFAGIRFQAIHAFRLVMARAAVSVLRMCETPPPFSVIDLDDDEYSRSERFLNLREQAGDGERAASERQARPQLRVIEGMLLPRFQSICLAAREDCERVRQRHPGRNPEHLPNAIFFPGAASPIVAAEGPIVAAKGQIDAAKGPPTFLFVGSLDYLPNEDAVQYFCTQILPLLRAKASRPVRVRLVGAQPKPSVTSLTRHTDVEVLANVPDVAPYYADADVVIAPLRAGSGTRIKILEAFSFRKPVVSTSIGAEGLAVTHGKQLLIADQPDAFAGACLQLIDDPVLRSTISEAAWQWLLENHSIDSFASSIRALYEPVLQRGARSAATSNPCSESPL